MTFHANLNALVSANTRAKLQALLRWGICGGASAIVQIAANGLVVDWRKAGPAFLGGFILAVANHLATPPGTTSFQTPPIVQQTFPSAIVKTTVTESK